LPPRPSQPHARASLSSSPSPWHPSAAADGTLESDLRDPGNPLWLFRFTSNRKRSSSSRMHRLVPISVHHAASKMRDLTPPISVNSRPEIRTSLPPCHWAPALIADRSHHAPDVALLDQILQRALVGFVNGEARHPTNIIGSSGERRGLSQRRAQQGKDRPTVAAPSCRSRRQLHWCQLGSHSGVLQGHVGPSARAFHLSRYNWVQCLLLW